MEITPEIQAQLDEQKKQCIFCKIISGEMDSAKVYNDKHMQAVLDINPGVKGHMLLLPKEHYPIMPYLPGEVFEHLFGMIAPLIGAAKQSLLTKGASVFVANGAVAGQQSPHFLVHLMPRDKGDKFTKFRLDSTKPLDDSKQQQVIGMLTNNIPLMMKNHFSRHPAEWHKGGGETPSYLLEIKGSHPFVYEDEKVLVTVASNPQQLGHMTIYSKEEENDFENLSKESAAHMFFVASFCATAAFEGLQAHGSNIILQTGECADSDGRLMMHVLPRYQDDGIDLLWEPMKDAPDAKTVENRLRDRMFVLEHTGSEEKKEVINFDTVETFGESNSGEVATVGHEDEIRKAMKKIREA
ncbi:MAG: HIT family protein [Candidatus Nanoarchaeia archaeon]